VLKLTKFLIFGFLIFVSSSCSGKQKHETFYIELNSQREAKSTSDYKPIANGRYDLTITLVAKFQGRTYPIHDPNTLISGSILIRSDRCGNPKFIFIEKPIPVYSFPLRGSIVYKSCRNSDLNPTAVSVDQLNIAISEELENGSISIIKAGGESVPFEDVTLMVRVQFKAPPSIFD